MENEKNIDIRHAAHESVDKVLDKAQNINESGREEIVKIKDKAIKMNEQVDESIRQNPKKAVLIAAGAGAVIGAAVAATMMKENHDLIEKETLPSEN